MFFLSLSSKGQFYFTDTTNRWYETSIYFSHPSYVTTSFQYFYDGYDSVNGRWYHKLKYRYFNTNESRIDTGFRYLIREDTLNGIVYAHNGSTSSKEIVLYDFRLKVGDSFAIDGIINSCIVDSVDTVEVNHHKHYAMLLKDIKYPNKDFWVIEGIGSSVSPFNHTVPKGTTSSSEFVCFKNKGVVPLINKLVSFKCADSSLSVSTSANSNYEIKVYPQPANNTLNFKLPKDNLINCVITIYDLSGRKVYVAENGSASLVTVNYRFQPGVYLYKIQSKEGATIKNGRVCFL